MADRKCEGHVMGRADHYLIFETAGGFCGIAWNSAGITRFQLPTKSATATERMLLRQVPGAKPGAPTPEVAEAVAAVRRYFEGKETDFSMFKLDLGEQDPFFERVYAAARQVGWSRTTTYGSLAKEPCGSTSCRRLDHNPTASAPCARSRTNRAPVLAPPRQQQASCRAGRRPVKCSEPPLI